MDPGARVLSVCSGAFILGEVSLLDGRRCTNALADSAEELARRYPAAKVDPDVLYVDDDPVITSATVQRGVGIDACLYLVRKERGSRVANGIARRMVVPPHRDGGQAQYVDQPITPSCDGTLRDLLEWLCAAANQPLNSPAIGPPGEHVRADLCPSFRAGHRHHAAALAHRAAHLAGSAVARGERRDDVDAIADRVEASAARPPCVTTSGPGAAPPPTPTEASSREGSRRRYGGMGSLVNK